MKAIAIGDLGYLEAPLKERGIETQVVGDGITGLRELIRTSPDFVIMQVELPLLNGINMVKTLGLLRIPIPVLFVSDHTQYKARAEAFAQTVGYFGRAECPSKLDDALLTRITEYRREHYTDHKAFDLHLDMHDWVNIMSRPGRKRLLLVEDSNVIKKYITALLEQPDHFEIYTADDGLEGLHKAVMINPDLIISDIAMPSLDGLSMSQLLYMLGKPFPIVFVTAQENNALLERARSLDGVLGYRLKSNLRDTARFQAEIGRYLEMGAMLREAAELTYQVGSLDVLRQTGTDEGIFRESSRGGGWS